MDKEKFANDRRAKCASSLPSKDLFSEISEKCLGLESQLQKSISEHSRLKVSIEHKEQYIKQLNEAKNLSELKCKDEKYENQVLEK